MFETKDSGEREEFDSGMVRDTERGKPRFDLLFPKGIPYTEQIMTRFAALMERGVAKYGERNWEQANSQIELDRAKSSAIRHMMQWANGETDEDHAAAVFFNLMQAETIRFKMSDKKPKPVACCSSGNPHTDGVGRLGLHWTTDGERSCRFHPNGCPESLYIPLGHVDPNFPQNKIEPVVEITEPFSGECFDVCEQGNQCDRVLHKEGSHRHYKIDGVEEAHSWETIRE